MHTQEEEEDKARREERQAKEKKESLLPFFIRVFFEPWTNIKLGMDNCIWVSYVQGEEEDKGRTEQKQEEKAGHCCFLLLQLKRLHKMDKAYDFSLNFLLFFFAIYMFVD